MSKHMNHEELEAKIRAMAEGFRRMPNVTTQFHIRGEPLLPMQVAQRMQTMAEGFQSIRDAENARREAEESLAKVLSDHRAFYVEAVEVVKSHYGSDRRKLTEFGVVLEEVQPQRRAPAPRVEREVIRTKVIEEVIGDRETRVNEVDTEEVIETTDAEPRGRGRGRPEGSPAGRGGTRRVPGNSGNAAPGATSSAMPVVAVTGKPSKPKSSQRR